jgi:predicted PurR-regulated permease PerM
LANSISRPSRPSALTVLTGTVVAVVAVGCLYWAQSIFIPVALAVFLTFLLSPLVTFLQRQRLGRVPAVGLAMLVAVLVLGGVVWLVTAQLSSLASQLPNYHKNIQAKLAVVQEHWERINRKINRVLSPHASDTEGEGGQLAAPQPPAVVVQPEAPAWLSRLPVVLGPVAHGLGGAGLALVLTAFMLLKREDLRNRLIRLAGQGQLTVATRALDEAGQRITRFLMMQALINAIAGLSIGLGLLALGVEYALLWGFLVFALRYIPYLGVWFAALPPVLLSFAMFQGWLQPLLVVALIVVVEMICGNVLEPWLFGRSMGVSEVSLLVSAAFWAFLWGPIGMVLSSPMTVCLVVLGKYNPRLKFLDVLLGDEPALDLDVRFYQRLLAHDEDEAADVITACAEQTPPEKLFDQVLIPALVSARRDRESGNLPDDDETFILAATREIGEELAERIHPAADEGPTDLVGRAHVLACPADDREDEVALRLLAATLDPARWQVEVLPADTLGSELVQQTAQKQPDLICIAALPPGSLAHTRYLCKRLRARYPRVKILVARWGEDEGESQTERLLQAGADIVATSLEETRRQLRVWRPVLTAHEAPSAGVARRERETTRA